MTAATPAKAIREHCVLCCGGVRQGEGGPNGCNSPACSLYGHRTRRFTVAQQPPALAMRPHDMPLPAMKRRAAGGSRLAAIRLRCLDCAGSAAAVKTCPATDCALWPYRLGHRPTTSRQNRPDGSADPEAHPTAATVSAGAEGGACA